MPKMYKFCYSRALYGYGGQNIELTDARSLFKEREKILILFLLLNIEKILFFFYSLNIKKILIFCYLLTWLNIVETGDPSLDCQIPRSWSISSDKSFRGDPWALSKINWLYKNVMSQSLDHQIN